MLHISDPYPSLLIFLQIKYIAPGEICQQRNCICDQGFSTAKASMKSIVITGPRGMYGTMAQKQRSSGAKGAARQEMWIYLYAKR